MNAQKFRTAFEDAVSFAANAANGFEKTDTEKKEPEKDEEKVEEKENGKEVEDDTEDLSNKMENVDITNKTEWISCHKSI